MGMAEIQRNTQAVEERKRSHSFDEALDLAGFGRGQLLLMLLAGVSMMTAVTEAMGLSIILPASHCDLELSSAQRGMVGGVIFLGFMVSAYWWGFLADTRGRQLVLKWALLATSGCSVASSFANDFGSLMALRFVTGLFVAAGAAIVFSYLGEFCTSARRVQILSYACVMPFLGIVYVALLGWWILSYEWSFPITTSIVFKPWRLLFIVYTLPGLFAGIAFCFCPESPKFLFSQGRSEDALAVLKMLYRINNGDKDYPVVALTPDATQSTHKSKEGFKAILRSMKEQTVPLFKMPYLTYFVVCCVNSMTSLGIYGGIGIWFPHIMNEVFSEDSSPDVAVCSILEAQKSTNHSQSITVCEVHIVQTSFLYTTAIGLLGAAYCFIISAMLGKISGRTMIITNMFVAGCAGVALQFVTSSYVVAVLFCTLFVFSALCINLINVIAAALFPTNIRGMAVSLVSMTGRFSCFMASAVVGLLMEHSCPMTFYVLSGILFTSGALTALLPR